MNSSSKSTVGPLEPTATQSTVKKEIRKEVSEAGQEVGETGEERQQMLAFLRRLWMRRGETSNPETVAIMREAVKRPRDVMLGCSPLRHTENKRPRLDTLRYIQLVSDHHIAITYEDYPEKRLPADLANSLMLQMMKVMREEKSEEGKPCFRGHGLREGVLVVKCKDTFSKEWLIRNVARCSPLEGIPIKACDIRDLENFRRLGTFVPNPVEDTAQCIAQLEAQNEGIIASKWKVLSSKKSVQGFYMLVSIPESQFKIVERNQFQLYHGFSHAWFVQQKIREPEKPRRGASQSQTAEARNNREGQSGENTAGSTSTESDQSTVDPASSIQVEPGSSQEETKA